MKKKGISAIIGWVLLVSMAVLLGTFMFNWSKERVEVSNSEMQREADSNYCSDVSIDISGICQNSQLLYMNISNTNMLNVENLVFNMLDIYGNPSDKEKEICLLAGDTYESFALLKQGTISQITATPLIIVDKNEVICHNSAVVYENIPQCQ